MLIFLVQYTARVDQRARELVGQDLGVRAERAEDLSKPGRLCFGMKDLGGGGSNLSHNNFNYFPEFFQKNKTNHLSFYE